MRILVVEDESELATILREGLRGNGYAVDVAHDGETGLELAQQEPYDVVVLDVLLPKLDGFTLCRQLREKGLRMGILMLTARDAVDDRVRGLNSGADDYLVKPFAFRELLARVAALLRSDGGTRDPILRVSDLEINTAAHEVRRSGESIELTAKEYAVLEYFARNVNHVLSRDQIAEHIWNYDFVAASNVVDVYVGNLRRKLHDDHEPRLFHTVRGVGYQLRAQP